MIGVLALQVAISGGGTLTDTQGAIAATGRTAPGGVWLYVALAGRMGLWFLGRNGSNMLVAPDASLDDGLFDISLYPEFSKTEALTYFATIMNERSAEDGKIQRYRARKLKIKASPKLEVLADGILLGKGTCESRCC
jgi:diacylglycerol kinase family enzyme